MATLKRRVGLAALVVALAASSLLMVSKTGDRAGGDAVKPEALTRVSIGIPSMPPNAAWFVGLERGLFAQEGVELVHMPFAVGLHALQAVRDGKADLAIVADTPFMFAVMEGAPIAIAVTTYNSRNALAVVARRDRGISQPSDLRGRTIGFVAKTNAHFFLDSFLLVHALGSGDVVLRDMSPTEIVPAFVEGTVDAISTWEPLITSASKAVGSNIVIYHSPEMYTFRFNLVGTRKYLDDHTDVLRAIIRALRKANDLIVEDPRLAAVITEQALGAPLGSPLHPDDYQTVLDQAELVAIEEQARWALANGLVPDQPIPNFLRHIAPAALLAEAPADVTLVH